MDKDKNPVSRSRRGWLCAVLRLMLLDSDMCCGGMSKVMCNEMGFERETRNVVCGVFNFQKKKK